MTGWLVALSLVGCGSTVQLRGASLPTGSEQLGSTPGASSDTAQGVGQQSSGQSLPQPSGLAAGSSNAKVGASGAASGSRSPGQPGAVGPTTGQGFDANKVLLGFNTIDESNTGSNYGINGLALGYLKTYAEAFMAYFNRSGGVLGRKLVGFYHDEREADIVGNPSATAQQTCTSLTQDGHVAVALVNDGIAEDTTTFYGCMAKARTPFLTQGSYGMLQSSYASFAPYIHLTMAAPWDNLAPTWLARLQAMGYFGGWNTATAAAGPAPVKVGILHVDTPAANAAATYLAAALKKRGVDVGPDSTYRDPNSSGAAAAAQDAANQAFIFKSRGITHVFHDTSGGMGLFLNAASSQGYYPRYALNSMLGLQGMVRNLTDKKELNGALGVGWLPSLEINGRPTSAQAARCLSILDAAGATYSSDNQSLTYALSICDQVFLFVAGATAGGGLDAAHLDAGLRSAGRSTPLGGSFQGAMSPTRMDNVGAVRDLEWSLACGCFAYRSNQLYPVD